MVGCYPPPTGYPRHALVRVLFQWQPGLPQHPPGGLMADAPHSLSMVRPRYNPHREDATTTLESNAGDASGWGEWVLCASSLDLRYTFREPASE